MPVVLPVSCVGPSPRLPLEGMTRRRDPAEVWMPPVAVASHPRRRWHRRQLGHVSPISVRVAVMWRRPVNAKPGTHSASVMWPASARRVNGKCGTEKHVNETFVTENYVTENYVTENYETENYETETFVTEKYVSGTCVTGMLATGCCGNKRGNWKSCARATRNAPGN